MRPSPTMQSRPLNRTFRGFGKCAYLEMIIFYNQNVINIRAYYFQNVAAQISVYPRQKIKKKTIFWPILRLWHLCFLGLLVISRCHILKLVPPTLKNRNQLLWVQLMTSLFAKMDLNKIHVIVKISSFLHCSQNIILRKEIFVQSGYTDVTGNSFWFS